MNDSLNPLTCKELVELVTDYLDGALSEADRQRFEQHLRACRSCRHYLEQIRHTIQLTGRLSEQTIDPAARDELLDLFRHWKAQRPPDTP